MGTQPSLQKGHSSPLIFGTCLLWPNGWVDQDATWYGGRPRLRRHCVRWRPSSPPRKGAQQPPLFVPCLLWPNGRHPSNCWAFVLYFIAALSVQDVGGIGDIRLDYFSRLIVYLNPLKWRIKWNWVKLLCHLRLVSTIKFPLFRSRIAVVPFSNSVVIKNGSLENPFRLSRRRQ